MKRILTYSNYNKSLALWLLLGLFSSAFRAAAEVESPSSLAVADDSKLSATEKVVAQVPEDLDTASTIGFGHRGGHGFRGTHFYGGIGGLRIFAGVRRNFGHFNHYRHGHIVPYFHVGHHHYGHYNYPIIYYGHGHHHGHGHYGHGHFG